MLAFANLRRTPVVLTDSSHAVGALTHSGDSGNVTRFACLGDQFDRIPLTHGKAYQNSNITAPAKHANNNKSPVSGD